MPFILFSLVVIFLSKPPVEGCSCFPTHPQAVYCNASFVILATPIKKILGPDEYSDVHYVLKRIIYLKADDASEVALRKSIIITASNSAMCGVELELNKEYLMTGEVNGHKARVDLCGFFGLWRNLSPYQRLGFKGAYKKGCDCNIEVCFGSDEQCGQCADNTCVMRSFCHSFYSRCQRDVKRKCNWNIGVELAHCLENETQ